MLAVDTKKGAKKATKATSRARRAFSLTRAGRSSPSPQRPPHARPQRKYCYLRAAAGRRLPPRRGSLSAGPVGEAPPASQETGRSGGKGRPCRRGGGVASRRPPRTGRGTRPAGAGQGEGETRAGLLAARGDFSDEIGLVERKRCHWHGPARSGVAFTPVGKSMATCV